MFGAGKRKTAGFLLHLESLGPDVGLHKAQASAWAEITMQHPQAGNIASLFNSSDKACRCGYPALRRRELPIMPNPPITSAMLAGSGMEPVDVETRSKSALAMADFVSPTTW